MLKLFLCSSVVLSVFPPPPAAAANVFWKCVTYTDTVSEDGAK